MRVPFGVVELIAAFHYEQICLNDGSTMYRDRKPGEPIVVQGNKIERSYLEPMFDHLCQMALAKFGTSYKDNKVAFLFKDDGGDYVAMSFWDSSATIISWGRFWGTNVPANIVRGGDRVSKAIRDYQDRNNPSPSWMAQ